MTEMPLRVKNSPQTTGLNNNRGQAMVEYVLLLIISVTLVLMLIYQIFKPMQAFVQAFMGDYVACLLETGALPTLSGTDTRAADMGCGAKFANGQYAAGSGSGANGSGGGNSSNSNNSNNSSNSNNNGSNSGANGSGADDGYAGSSSRGPGSRGSGRKGNDGAGSGAKAAPVVANNEFVEGSGFTKGGSSNGWGSSQQGRRVASIEYITLSSEDKKKIDEKKDRNSNPLLIEEGLASPTKKLALKIQEKKTEIPPDDEPFTIGSFMRIIFIACIILAIFVFVGGQALQMSKSSEK